MVCCGGRIRQDDHGVGWGGADIVRELALVSGSEPDRLAATTTVPCALPPSIPPAHLCNMDTSRGFTIGALRPQACRAHKSTNHMGYCAPATAGSAQGPQCRHTRSMQAQ